MSDTERLEAKRVKQLIRTALDDHAMVITKCKCGWRCDDPYKARYALNAVHRRHVAERVADAVLGVPASPKEQTDA